MRSLAGWMSAPLREGESGSGPPGGAPSRPPRHIPAGGPPAGDIRGCDASPSRAFMAAAGFGETMTTLDHLGRHRGPQSENPDSPKNLF